MQYQDKNCNTDVNNNTDNNCKKTIKPQRGNIDQMINEIPILINEATNTNQYPQINIYNYGCGQCIPGCDGKTPTPTECKSKFNTCSNLSNGKDKIPIEEKVRRRLNNSSIPSAIGGYIIKCMRRYLAKEKPYDDLEKAIFEIFKTNSVNSDLNYLKCVVNNVDKLSRLENDLIFDEALNGNTPIGKEELTQLILDEAKQRYAEYANINNSGCTNSLGGESRNDCVNSGMAGKPRPDIGVDEEPVLYPKVFSINNLRTSQHVPSLGFYDYKAEEFEYDCTDKNNCIPRVCLLSDENCCSGDFIIQHFEPFSTTPGAAIRYCLAVPKTKVGSTVMLKGVNFVDPNPKIRLEFNAPDGPVYKYIDATTCGDLTTPITETINGVEKVILDNRVNDVIKFTIPNTLGIGLFKFQVVLKNTTGIGLDDTLLTEPLYFEILPNDNSRFRISVNKVECVNESNPEFDEDDFIMGTVAVPIYQNLLVGAPTSIQIKHDFDSGDSYPASDIIYEGSNMIALTIAIIAVDSDALFGGDITKTLLEYARQAVINAVKETIVKNGISVETAILAGLGIAIYFGIGAILDFSNDDPLIKDSIYLTWDDLAKNTIVGYPKHGTKSYSVEDINVNSKIISSPNDNSCIEQRDYWSEDSHYRLYLKYERL
ncbi:Uncharacterised protein [uncultured Clostridium sp.]|uniref:hypothetical protein n=1 Tax=uncultured Clostridium sp. TaxID=59620 RepID=UPI000822E246|nr:hypothetical protein [uncultured Clostridium sp.]SCK03194.1 Uncharacterised protein [uncultured Clostridium sp.]